MKTVASMNATFNRRSLARMLRDNYERAKQYRDCEYLLTTAEYYSFGALGMALHSDLISGAEYYALSQWVISWERLKEQNKVTEGLVVALRD